MIREKFHDNKRVAKNEAACIDCGRCRSVCPQQNKREFATIDSPTYFFQKNSKRSDWAGHSQKQSI